MDSIFKQAWQEASIEVKNEMWPFPKFGIGKTPPPSKFEEYLRKEYLNYKRQQYEILSSQL